MTKEQLELRMYFFVPYQLTGIQQGIQCGHAALEYAMLYFDDPQFTDFASNWKTWVILNGGTTNSRIEDSRDLYSQPVGTLNQIIDKLHENGINFTFFSEPDLQDAVTSICFICDERVFNRKKYPDFNTYVIANLEGVSHPEIYNQILGGMYVMDYDKWTMMVGGNDNEFLRNLIKDKKLA